MSYFFTRKFNRVDVVWITVASMMAGKGDWWAFAAAIVIGNVVSILGEIRLASRACRPIKTKVPA